MINKPTPEDWYYIQNVSEIDSPSLIIFPDRVQANINQMIGLVGDAERLRPHVKTHKMAEVVQMQLDAGIWKFKCATIAEAEMLAILEVQDVLIAYQPVGPKINRVLALIQKFPQTRFSVLIDNQESAEKLDRFFKKEDETITVFLDIDVGMHRTGVNPEKALDLFSYCRSLSSINPTGLHAYDGHVHNDDKKQRQDTATEVQAIIDQLYADIGQDIEIVVSGTPSFPYHAQRKKYTCSPGTSLLWDWRYSTMCDDQDLSHAAIVISRVISKPSENLICVDLGHKSIASEMPFPRVHFLNLPHAKQIRHSEEHLVMELEENTSVHIGDLLYGIPMHICPTVALHETVEVVREQSREEIWEVVARKRKITI